MVRLRAWIWRMMGIAVLWTVADTICRDSMKKGVRLILALGMLVVMAAPFPGVLERVAQPDFGTLWDMIGSGQASDSDLEALEAEKWQSFGESRWREEVLRVLWEQFEVAETDCRVVFEMGEGDRVTVWVALSGKAVLRDPRAIESVIGSAFGCDCRVVVE